MRWIFRKTCSRAISIAQPSTLSPARYTGTQLLPTTTHGAAYKHCAHYLTANFVFFLNDSMIRVKHTDMPIIIFIKQYYHNIVTVHFHTSALSCINSAQNTYKRDVDKSHGLTIQTITWCSYNGCPYNGDKSAEGQHTNNSVLKGHKTSRWQITPSTILMLIWQCYCNCNHAFNGFILCYQCYWRIYWG